MESTSETGHGQTGECAIKSLKMILGYRDWSYEERLQRCGLQHWREGEVDLIKAYKIITGKDAPELLP